MILFSRRPPLSDQPLPHALLFPVVHQGKSLGEGVRRFPPQGSHRTGFPESRLLQSPIRGPEGLRVLETHHRPVYLEHIHSIATLPHGDSSVRPTLHSPRRLDDLIGPSGHLPSSSNTPGIMTVSSLHDGRSPVPVQGTMLRANNCPSGFYKAYGPNIRHSPSLRYQDPPIPRRLVDSSRIQDHLYSCEGQAPAPMRGAGTTSEPQKVITSPITGHDLSRNATSVSSVHCKTTETRIGNLLRVIEEFLSSPSPPASLYQRLLGHLSSLTLLVKGGRLRMRSLQLCLSSKWNFRDDHLRIPWDPLCQEDLLWWSWAIQQRQGVHLSLPVPDLSFYSDASDVGWGAVMGDQQVSGVWTPCQKQLSINLREMMAVQKGLLGFSQFLRGKTIALFCDNVTTVAYLRRSGGDELQGPIPQSERDPTMGRINANHDPPPVHPGLSQLESGSPQSAEPSNRLRVDTAPTSGPGTPSQVAGNNRPICNLADGKALSILCPSVETQGSGGRCIPPTLGQPPGVCLSSDSHHKESSSQTKKLSPLRSHPDRTILASKRMVSRSAGTSIRHSDRTTQTSRSAETTAFPSVSRKSPNASV